MIERVIYQCEHCYKRKLMNKSAMKKHEKECWYNPENKTCVTCKYGEQFLNYGVYTNECNHPNRIKEFEGSEPKLNCLMWEEWEEQEDNYE